MSADYLVASLPTLAFDAPPPMTREAFDARCAEQLGPAPFAKEEAAWRDLETQIRNAAAAERAAARGDDPARWKRPAKGLSLFLAQRVAEAFREKDPAKRETALDRIKWEAAGELVPPHSPLSAAAAFAYGIRLDIAARRNAAKQEAGREIFEKLTASAADRAIPE